MSPPKKKKRIEPTPDRGTPELRRSPRKSPSKYRRTPTSTTTTSTSTSTTTTTTTKIKASRRLNFGMSASSPDTSFSDSETSVSPTDRALRSNTKSSPAAKRVFQSLPPRRSRSRSPFFRSPRKNTDSPDILSASPSPKETCDKWAVFTLHHPSLLLEFDAKEAQGGGNIHNVVKEWRSIAKSTGKLPGSMQIGISDSHPSIFRVHKKRWDASNGLTLSSSRYMASSQKRLKSAVKINFKGLLGQCLKCYVGVGEVLLLYGEELDPAKNRFEINPNRETRNIYCVIIRTKGVAAPKAGQRLTDTVPVFPNSQIISVIIPAGVGNKSSRNLALTMNMAQPDPLSSTLVISYPTTFNFDSESQVGEERALRWESILQRSPLFRSSSLSNSQVIQNPSPNVERRKENASIEQTAPQNNDGGGEAVLPDIVLGAVRMEINNVVESVPIIREAHPSRPTTPEPHPPNVHDIDKINYADFIESKWFIEGESRPSLIKVKGRQYEYVTLKTLDDKLNGLVKQQSERGFKPTMMLPEQQFIHALVVEVLPHKYPKYPTHRLLVSDETKDRVVLRICASPKEPTEGPEIKAGDVIRVHRAQVEYSMLSSRHEMVLSTTPHRNYVIFGLRPGKIVCDTLAKTFTYHEETDVPRIKSLFQLKHRLEQDSEIIMFSDDWDGNTSRGSLAIRDVSPDPEDSSSIDTTSSSNSTLDHSQSSLAIAPVVTNGQNTGPDNTVSSASRQRGHYSPDFHVPGPSYPI